LVNHLFRFEDELNARVIIISSENESFVRGIELLRNQYGTFYEMDFTTMGDVNSYYKRPSKDLSFTIFHPALLVFVGTSTVYLHLNSAHKYTFLSSSAISGQTFFGLCNQMHQMTVKDHGCKNEVKSFHDCLKMASDGQHDVYDSTLKQIYANDDYKLEQHLFLHKQLTNRKDDFIKEFGDTPICMFGEVKAKKTMKIKVKSISKTSTNKSDDQQDLNDFAAGTLNLVCYQIAETMILYSKLLKTNIIVCAGTFLTNNLMAKKLIAKYLNLLAHNTVQLETNKKRLFFLDNEVYLAALGCMAIDANTIESVCT
jgi:pantothenate kinase